MGVLLFVLFMVEMILKIDDGVLFLYITRYAFYKGFLWEWEKLGYFH